MMGGDNLVQIPQAICPAQRFGRCCGRYAVMFFLGFILARSRSSFIGDPDHRHAFYC